MNSKEYFRACLAEHKAETSEIDLDITKRLGWTRTAIVNLANANSPERPSLSNYKALSREIPTIEEGTLLTMIVEERYPDAAADLSKLLVEEVLSDSELDLIYRLRAHLASLGWNRDWAISDAALDGLTSHAAQVILKSEAEEAQS